MAYIGNSPANVGNYQIVDDISASFNGTTTSFALTASSQAITPAKSGQLLVSLNGVLQEPDDTGTDGFKVSGSNIVFSSAPASGSTFWCMYQGQNVDIGTPSAGTVGTTQMSYPLANFTSTGIDDNADATAITISSSEKVRVGVTSDSDKALISTWQSNDDAGTSIGGTSLAMAMQHYGGANSVVQMGLGYCVNHPPAVIGYQVETNTGHTKGDIFFATRDTTNDVAPTERLRITVDGRGLSQFTAKVWCRFNGTGSISINDSHNVSSLSDLETGKNRVNFSNSLVNSDYACSVTAWVGYAGNSGIDDPATNMVTCISSHGTAYADSSRTNLIVFGD